MSIYKVPYRSLPFIKSLIKDYYNGSQELRYLYDYPPTLEGLKSSIKSISSEKYDSATISKIIEHNYSDVKVISDAEKQNINRLKNGEKCIVTAHQPCLFLGPLYTISKGISAITLAEEMGVVPVFVVGGEDHDKEEILQCTVFGEKFVWETKQKGSVGAFVIDESLIEVREQFCEKLGTNESAEKLKELYRKHYSIGNTISRAFSGVMMALLGEYGLLVFDNNIPEVKQKMKQVWKDELSETMVLNTTLDTLSFLEENYHIQASPRDINLFQYRDGERVLVKESNEELIVFSQSFPESFSPNVTLRPLMQEMALPCVAYVGGASEVAYWLELKEIFEKYERHFPVVMVRDMMIPLDEKSWNKWSEMGLTIEDFFEDIDVLKKRIVLEDSSMESEFEQIRNQTLSEFSTLSSIMENIDKTLISSFESEKKKIEKSMENLLTKSIRAEKRNAETQLAQLERIKDKVNGSKGLTERTENVSAYITRYGFEFIKKLKECSNPLDPNLKIVVL